MQGFIRQPVKIRMLTTCCERCGKGLEVTYVRHELKQLADSAAPTYREAEDLLNAWEDRHPGECSPAPALLTA